MCLRLAALSALLVCSSASVAASECVILLHGLARTSSSMARMQDALIDAGFETINVDYPSRHHPIEELAPIALESGLSGCRAIEGIERVHFVTHSLGGILVRQYLAENEIPELGRVVMLAPPNQGSVAADRLRNVPGFEWMNGPAGSQLGKGEESVPLQLGPADFELGVIAGNRSIDPIASAVLPNPEDGRVTVDDTKLDGMSDFIVVDHSHAFIMRMRKTIELTLGFLKTGRFSADEAGSEAG
ncbi:MAG: alpha/beta fold hydrolase [Woeseiaceae bacterium]|nr:alpha/beta fold hydrolase [Woeseiaceae bacterium]